MATGKTPREYSAHQRKIIDRYYKNRDTLALQKLGDLVTEIYLAESDRKRDQLWGRVEKAIAHFDISDALREHILTSRSPEILAQNLQDWTRSPPALKKRARRQRPS